MTKCQAAVTILNSAKVAKRQPMDFNKTHSSQSDANPRTHIGGFADDEPPGTLQEYAISAAVELRLRFGCVSQSISLRNNLGKRRWGPMNLFCHGRLQGHHRRGRIGASRLATTTG